MEQSKAAGAKGARSKGPKGGKWTKEEVSSSVKQACVRPLESPAAVVLLLLIWGRLSLFEHRTLWFASDISFPPTLYMVFKVLSTGVSLDYFVYCRKELTEL